MAIKDDLNLYEIGGIGEIKNKTARFHSYECIPSQSDKNDILLIAQVSEDNLPMFKTGYPNGQKLRHVKHGCRPLIIDGPNCVIGCLPDRSVFMVQDSKKLRPGVVGGGAGMFAFSSEMCGLDAAIPARNKSEDFQPMKYDTVMVPPNRQEVVRWNQWER